MDLMSFLRNDEVNAVILNRDFATQMEAMFDEDLRGSTQVNLEEWRKRALTDRVKEWSTHVLGYWL